MSGDHGARIAQHSAAIQALERGQEVLFEKLDKAAGKLDAITTALHELRGAAGPSIKDILIIGGICAGLFSAVSGGIIYLARGGNSEALHRLELRVQAVELRMQYGSKTP